MIRKIHVYAVFAGFLTITEVLVAARSSPQSFRVRDDRGDPATFNAAPPVGPGAGEICNPNFDGDTTFAEFIEELTEDQTIGHWRFNPEDVRLDRGQGTEIESRGGEFHTFTRVAEFGGGILPGLNALTGAGPTRAECGVPDVLAPPSATNIFVSRRRHVRWSDCRRRATSKGNHEVAVLHPSVDEI